MRDVAARRDRAAKRPGRRIRYELSDASCGLIQRQPSGQCGVQALYPGTGDCHYSKLVVGFFGPQAIFTVALGNALVFTRIFRVRI